MSLLLAAYTTSTGDLREIYDRMRDRLATVGALPVHAGPPGIVQAHGLDPALIARVFATAATLSDGPLSAPERELMYATTARANQCVYEAGCHVEFLRTALDGELALPRAVLADPRALGASTPAHPRLRVLAELAVRVTDAPWTLARTHREDAHAAGLSDDELLHAIVLAAYAGHLTRIADAVGIPLDYAVELTPPPADPTTPALATAPIAVTGRPAIDLGRRPATAAALAAWRTYVFDRDAPLSRRLRTVIARWVALWLGDGGISAPDDLTFNPLDDAVRALAEQLTLAPWSLDDASFARLRAAGFEDAALFDACVAASSAGMFSRITVALSALGRERA